MRGRKAIDREKIKTLYSEGMGYLSIAKQMNCTVMTVRNAIQELKEQIGIVQLQKAFDENRVLKAYVKKLEKSYKELRSEVIKWKKEATYLSEEMRHINNEKIIKKMRTKFDCEKIMALHKAGWTCKKIAEEMGCSYCTARNIILSINESLKEGNEE